MHLKLEIVGEDALVDDPAHPMTAYAESLADAVANIGGKCSPDGMSDFFNDLAQTAAVNGVGGDDESDGFPVTSVELPEGFTPSERELARFEFETYGIELR
jgi:hypothetical protein